MFIVGINVFILLYNNKAQNCRIHAYREAHSLNHYVTHLPTNTLLFFLRLWKQKKKASLSSVEQKKVVDIVDVYSETMTTDTNMFANSIYIKQTKITRHYYLCYNTYALDAISRRILYRNGIYKNVQYVWRVFFAFVSVRSSNSERHSNSL